MTKKEELQAETLGVVKEAVDQWRTDLRLALAHHEEVVAGSLDALQRAASLDVRSHLEPRLAGVLTGALGSTDPGGQPAAHDLGWLTTAVAAVDRASTLGEALVTLVDQAAGLAEHSAVFIVKAHAAVGWYGSGTTAGNVKALSIPLEKPGLLAEAFSSRQAVSTSGTAAPNAVVELSGGPVTAHSIPLIVRDKVSALLYLDSATELPAADIEALSLLTRYTARVVEVLSGRPNGRDRSRASHATAPEPHTETPAGHSGDTATVAGDGAGATLTSDDEGAYDQARRFARLVVSEIKLYNEAKLSEGRRNRDIYKRLKDDIERGRRLYAGRVPAPIRENTNYYNDELVRVLAAGDPGALGPT